MDESRAIFVGTAAGGAKQYLQTSRANPAASAAGAAAGTVATEIGKSLGMPGLGRFARNLMGGLMR